MLRILQLTLLSWLCFGVTHHAAAAWFTIIGDSKLPDVDIVEVDTQNMNLSGSEKTLHIRVNRSNLRTSWDGVSYRSYTAMVLVNCSAKTARYQSLVFYMQPIWSDASHKTSVYSDSVVRPMLFRSMEPNPTERIIRAACSVASPAAITPGAQK
ncbi:MAG: hypothetical protein WBK51_05590 [Polaromonas sp.]